jgi:hypothetical protein
MKFRSDVLNEFTQGDRWANRLIVAVAVIGALLNAILVVSAGFGVIDVIDVAFRSPFAWLVYGLVISLSRLSGYKVRPALIVLVVVVSAIAFLLNLTLGGAAAASV